MIPHNAVLKRHYKKKLKVISILKENLQPLELFFEKYPEKHEAFKYLLKNFALAISAIGKEMYEAKTKYHFRNYFIELSNAKVSYIKCTQFHLIEPGSLCFKL